MPSDPDDPEHLPDKLVFSANSAHLAVCYNSGSVVVYELELPPSYYVAARPDNAAPAPAGPGAGKLTLVLHMTVATVKGERDSNGSQLLGQPWRGGSIGVWFVGNRRCVWHIQAPVWRC